MRARGFILRPFGRSMAEGEGENAPIAADMNAQIHQLKGGEMPVSPDAGAPRDVIGIPESNDSRPPGGGDGPSERLARMEGRIDGLRDAIDSLRHAQNLFMGLAGIAVAILIFVIGYAITRIDNLPADFERMNQTLSQAITASKQQAPQVILLPAPLQTPAPKTQK